MKNRPLSRRRLSGAGAKNVSKFVKTRLTQSGVLRGVLTVPGQIIIVRLK